MENRLPTASVILTGRESKSPLPEAVSSPEPDGGKSPSRDSPDSRCVICLGRLRNRSFTDSCLHQFCFQCLLQWSKVKAECPLCKQPFKSIIHNVRSNLDYDQYNVERPDSRYVLSDIVHSYNFDLVPVDRSFRYRSTMTREYFRDLAESFFVHTRRLPEDPFQIAPVVPVDPTNVGFRRPSHFPTNTILEFRARQRGTSEYRRNIYVQDLWVQDLVDITGRYRESSPQFYRDNPAQIHRIIPWLNREVNVLLSHCHSHSAYVLSMIIRLLTQHPIRSKEFSDHVRPYFGVRTDHFIHELYTFARSVYDIAGFDQNAQYETNPNRTTEVQEIISSADNDSEVEVLDMVKLEDKKSRQGLRKLLLKRASDAERKSDEPVAGPSGITVESAGPSGITIECAGPSGTPKNVSQSIDICDSDLEEVKVLGYVKPEPEVVTLSSGEDTSTFSDLDTSSMESVKVTNMETIRTSNDFVRVLERRRSGRGKGKCRSNGYGLKGKQKWKYLKMKKHRSGSTNSNMSSISISDSSSSSSVTCSTCTNWSRSSCRSRKPSKNGSVPMKKRSRSESSSSRSSHKSSNKTKRKKSKVHKKKLKKKTSRKYKSGSDSERKKKKKVRSCVVVPNLPSASSSSERRRGSIDVEEEEEQKLKSYWYMAINGKLDGLEDRKQKRKHREDSDEEKPRKRSRSGSSSSGSSVQSVQSGGSFLNSEGPSSSKY